MSKLSNLKTLYKSLKQSENFFLIAGPCVIEDDYTMLKTSEVLKEITTEMNIPFVFKSSFIKANRTSAGSYTGVGITKGLKVLQRIKKEFNVPVLTDIHETVEVEQVAEVADILQIPAFLSRQTPLIVKAAKTGKIINLKKGQFLAPEDMKLQCEKIIKHKNNQIILTERGTSFGYHNLVVDMRSFAIMKANGFPVVFDVTHSMQKPSENKTSGGTPEYAPMMAKAALATGYVDGLFIETHPNPRKALSDANTQLPLDSIKKLINDLLIVYYSVK